MSLAPNRRNVKMVFQHLALFPMMNVGENIAYGLQCRGEKKADIPAKVRRVLERVGLPGVEQKQIGQLSGGQKQRIAIARCMVLEPDVLLLDEPLGALDLKLREHMKIELKQLQHQFETTFLYITHDQSEALVMSDRVAVMNAGRFEQIGTPRELYDDPVSGFVAGFVGEQNVFTGKVTSVEKEFARTDGPGGTFTGRRTPDVTLGDQAVLMVRPERTGLVDGDGNGNGVNRLTARVEGRELEGPYLNLVTRDATGRRIVLHLANDGSVHPATGATVIGFRPEDAIVMPVAERPVAAAAEH